MSSLRFFSLSKELQQEVMRQCETKDLLSLARTSKLMHILALPVLYRCVDISCHNQTGLFISVHSNSMVEADNPDRKPDLFNDVLLRRQKRFLRTLTMHPMYSTYVLSFIWTFQTNEDDLYNFQLPTWKALQSLVRVKTVEICSFNWEEVHAIPPNLFPSATSVRVGGRMPYAFLQGIISVQPSKLVSLELDNIQVFGQLRDGERLPYTDDLSEFPEYDDSNRHPRIRHPGLIRGYLRQIEGLCTSLRHLYLRRVGQDDYKDNRWSCEKDQDRYQEWASFIDSVKPTLETLVIEQGIEPEEESTSDCGRSWIGREHQIGRPMDARFMEYVMPVILSGPWPKLKRIEIHGVGGEPRREFQWKYTAKDPAVFDTAKDQLRIALGAGIIMIWEAQASKSFYMYSTGVYYSSVSDPPYLF